MENPDKTTPLDRMEKSSIQTCNVVDHNIQTNIPMSRRIIIKNLLILSMSFLFLFTAFQSLQNLQSSLNTIDGLGTVSLSVIYAVGMLAGIFLPPLIIKRLGCKWTLASSMMCYIAFMGANLHAVWATMIPASALIGLGAATLWAAKCTYLTQMGAWYAQSTNTSRDGAISAFFGVFFMAFQTSQIWGNVISSSVFSQHVLDNQTVSEETLSKCGSRFCPTDYQNNTNLDRPDKAKIYTVCGIYLGCASLAVAIVVLFLDRIDLESYSCKKSNMQLLSSIATHFYSSDHQKLLIPLTVYSGLEQAFIAGDFTQSFISCSIGVKNVGYVMIAYGIADAVGSLIIGRLVKFTGFIPWFALAFLAHGGTLMTLLLWRPTLNQYVIFYMLAMFWGIGDAVVQTLINALYGCLFTKNPEAAFASYRLCESAGFIFAFGYSAFVCTYVKICVCLAMLIVGMLLYGVVEILLRRNNATKEPDSK